jgi:hypothetical protein
VAKKHLHSLRQSALSFHHESSFVEVLVACGVLKSCSQSRTLLSMIPLGPSSLLRSSLALLYGSLPSLLGLFDNLSQ